MYYDDFRVKFFKEIVVVHIANKKNTNKIMHEPYNSP